LQTQPTPYTAEEACNDTVGGFGAYATALYNSIGIPLSWTVPSDFAPEDGMNEICAETCDTVCKNTNKCESACATGPHAPHPPSPPSTPQQPTNLLNTVCNEFLRRWHASVARTLDTLGSATTHRAVHDRTFSKHCWQYTHDADRDACNDALWQSGYSRYWWSGDDVPDATEGWDLPAVYRGPPPANGTTEYDGTGQFHACFWDDRARGPSGRLGACTVVGTANNASSLAFYMDVGAPVYLPPGECSTPVETSPATWPITVDCFDADGPNLTATAFEPPYGAVALKPCDTVLARVAPVAFAVSSEYTVVRVVKVRTTLPVCYQMAGAGGAYFEVMTADECVSTPQADADYAQGYRCVVNDDGTRAWSKNYALANRQFLCRTPTGDPLTPFRSPAPPSPPPAVRLG